MLWEFLGTIKIFSAMKIATLSFFCLLIGSALAAPVTNTFQGSVRSATTANVLDGSAQPPSSAELEYVAGTPISLTFTYDPEAPVALTYFDRPQSLYDAPFRVSGLIGGRAFSANAGLVSVLDGPFPGQAADLLQLVVFPSFAREVSALTQQTITETAPFSDGFRLDSFSVTFSKSDGSAYSSTALPSNINFAEFDEGRFFFSYLNPAYGPSQVPAETQVFGSAVAPVPEPATLIALGVGAATLSRRRKTRA